jgi:hypothetical protein
MIDEHKSEAQGPGSETPSSSTKGHGDKAANSSPNSAGTKNQFQPIKDWFAQWRARKKKKWYDAAPHEREMVLLTRVIALSTAFYTIFAGWTLWEIHSGSKDTHELALAAKATADWTQRQTQFLFDEQRPQVWVKMLDNIHVEVGKSIAAKVEVFNYSQFPAQVWAYGYAEVGNSLIEKIRDRPRSNLAEGKDTLIILLAPHEGTKDFPMETQGRVLTKEDFRLITSGEMEVVVYGHINYSDPRNPWLPRSGIPDVFVTRFMSSFCFHRLKDGTVSVCPNYQGAYTNWEP